MQDNVLRTLTDRLRLWRYKGTWDARRGLHDLLTACSAALQAQYYRTTNGLDPETNAELAARRAVAKLGKNADPYKKHQLAKKAAEQYII